MENWCKDKSYTETNEIKSETLHWHTVKAFALVHKYTFDVCAHSACVCAHAHTRTHIQLKNMRICIDIEELETGRNHAEQKRIQYTNRKMKKEKMRYRM